VFLYICQVGYKFEAFILTKNDMRKKLRLYFTKQFIAAKSIYYSKNPIYIYV